MRTWTGLLALTLGGLLGVGSAAHAQARSGNSGKGTVIWTVAGAGGGFGVGLWVGLTKFDDAINSDRKVWTSAVVGAAVGAVGAYLIGRSRAARSRPNPPSRLRSVSRPAPFHIRNARAPRSFSFQCERSGDFLASSCRTPTPLFSASALTIRVE